MRHKTGYALKQDADVKKGRQKPANSARPRRIRAKIDGDLADARTFILNQAPWRTWA